MANKKQKLIERETKSFNNRIKNIKTLPDSAEDLGYGFFCSFDDEAKIDKVITPKDLDGELHLLRQNYGDYKIQTYWIPYDGRVCVTYKFDNFAVWFHINTDDEQEVITRLSNGKCKVEEWSQKTIVCEV